MPDIFRFHGFTLDTSGGVLTGPLGPVALRPKALALLEFLVRGAGRALGKDEILKTVWSGVIVNEETLTQTVHELRRALGDDAQALIRTVPRRGYLFPLDALETVSRRGRSLTVLPFENLSSDPEQAFFAAGLRLDLEAALGLVGRPRTPVRPGEGGLPADRRRSRLCRTDPRYRPTDRDSRRPAALERPV